MTEAGTDKTMEKRRRILDAARFLALRNGLRGTTMEAIAREARIAKPTLYAQFADKEAVFEGILDELMGQLQQAYDRGMAGQGDVAERIGAALAGKYRVIAHTLVGSPHADELFAVHGRGGGRERELDRRIEQEVTSVLSRAGAVDAAGLARLVLAAAYGIARQIGDEDEIAEAIPLMCRRLIRPELGKI